MQRKRGESEVFVTVSFKRATDITVLCQLLLLFGLGISGSVTGLLSDILYFAAFIIPTVLGVRLGMRLGVSPQIPTASKKSLVGLLPLIFPAVLLIIGISALTSFVLSSFGFENEVILYPTIFENLIRHALIPAVLEEAVFRYLPVTLFGATHRRGCVLISSITFALIHCNLFQIPYAFVAGVVFVSLNIMLDSHLPSLILHLVNNTVSVISLYYRAELPILAFVLVAAFVSVLLIVIKRKFYIDESKRVFAAKSKLELSNSLLLILIPTLVVAILNLFG